DISKHAISTMIASSGVNDTYRIYATTKRDGIKFRLAHIKNDFDVVSPGPFDRKYMNALYQYGYQLGRRGYRWRKRPLDFSN
ncbi:MAG: patatin family protein, partial [Pseudomonadota bacterium]